MLQVLSPPLELVLSLSKGHCGVEEEDPEEGHLKSLQKPALLPKSPSTEQGPPPLSEVKGSHRKADPSGSWVPGRRGAEASPSAQLWQAGLLHTGRHSAAPCHPCSSTCSKTQDSDRISQSLLQGEASLVSLVLAGRWHPRAWEGGRCPPQRQEAASGVKAENVTSAAMWAGAQASTCLAGTQAISIPLEGQAAWHRCWQLLT